MEMVGLAKYFHFLWSKFLFHHWFLFGGGGGGDLIVATTAWWSVSPPCEFVHVRSMKGFAYAFVK